MLLAGDGNDGGPVAELRTGRGLNQHDSVSAMPVPAPTLTRDFDDREHGEQGDRRPYRRRPAPQGAIGGDRWVLVGRLAGWRDLIGWPVDPAALDMEAQRLYQTAGGGSAFCESATKRLLQAAFGWRGTGRSNPACGAHRRPR
jgi:hypothetical protein